MKFGVITFPGSNCDHDMIYALEQILEQEVINLWHKRTDIDQVDAIVLPGGFSYGDYLRSGAIAKFSPIMGEVIRFANKGGLVFGICNGFQILCESGLLPGALLHNQNQKFICKNTYIKPANFHSPLTNGIPNVPLKIPIAHAEGRFFISQDGLKALQDNNQIVFQYCDMEGNISNESNPNGSILNIAGVSNITGNVIGMMPHPERAIDASLKNTDGLRLFRALIQNQVDIYV